jgi:hypothetical protein
MIRLSRSSLALAVSFAALSSAPAAQDIWKGKPRQEIVALLGEPQSTKKLREGGELIVYKLVRLGPDVLPAPGMLLITLPGYGLLGRIPAGEKQERASEIEPIALDSEGRPVGGGMTQTESRTMTWSKKDGMSGDPAPAPGGEPQPKGKVKLSFELDRSGTVRTWSATPPPHS